MKGFHGKLSPVPFKSKWWMAFPEKGRFLWSHTWELRCRPTKITLHDSIGTRTISVQAGSSRTFADQQGEIRGCLKIGNPKSNEFIIAFSTSKKGIWVYRIWRQTYFGRRTVGFVFGLLGCICFLYSRNGPSNVGNIPLTYLVCLNIGIPQIP